MNLVTKSEFDLIGQEVVITDSKNKEIVGIKGKITMETKNMFVINTKTQIQTSNIRPAFGELLRFC